MSGVKVAPEENTAAGRGGAAPSEAGATSRTHRAGRWSASTSACYWPPQIEWPRGVGAYDAAAEMFRGEVVNTTAATVTQVRVEIHLSNGIELGADSSGRTRGWRDAAGGIGRKRPDVHLLERSRRIGQRVGLRRCAPAGGGGFSACVVARGWFDSIPRRASGTHHVVGLLASGAEQVDQSGAGHPGHRRRRARVVGRRPPQRQTQKRPVERVPGIV